MSGHQQQLAGRGPRLQVGVLFHYFPEGREELLLAVASREAGRVLEDLQPYLRDLTSWQDWRDTVVDRYRRQGTHCPLGVLITEVGRSTPAAQAVTRQLLGRWQDDVRAGITVMQQAGHITPRGRGRLTAPHRCG